MKDSTLKGKKILVTAGTTWVSIDNVRVITNVFGGTTGYRIAILAAQMGANVTLLLGPHNIEDTTIFADESIEDVMNKVKKNMLDKEKILIAGGSLKIVQYKYFQELMDLMEDYISTKEFSAVVHSAAVADYAPVKTDGKIGSGLAGLSIETTQTPKIIKHIKTWDANIVLVQFKLEVGLTEENLLKRAFDGLTRNNSDLVVANNKKGSSETTAAGYIMDKNRNVIVTDTRREMYEKILSETAKMI